MSNNDDQIARIRSTWVKAAANPARTAQVFYSNLFRLDPSTKPLFVGDLRLQGAKLTQTLSFIVDHLEHDDVLLPAAADLALRHVDYGVKSEQYSSVGAALIATFNQLLGAEFSPEDEDAWATVYQGLSGAMIDVAYAG